MLEDKQWVHHRYLAAEVLAVRQLIVTDDDGVARITLSVDDDGVATINFIDLSQHSRMYAVLSKSGRASVVMRGPSNDVLDIGVSPEGDPQLRMYDTGGTMRSAVYIKDERPAVKLYDKAGTARLSAFLEENGCPAVEFLAGNGDVQSKVTVASNGEEGIIIEESSGTVT
jgi:hypothetical protein